jgi:lipopolysaccharide export system protein LptA
VRRLSSVLLTTAAVWLAALAPVALAERADRDKPTLLEGAQCTTEELKQTSVCSGNVVLTRGTLRITGERLEVRQDPEGFRTAVVTGPSGGLARFRQRRDATRAGVEEWVEGQAERIEYDERTEIVRFIRRANWKRLENELPRDEVVGQLITYNAQSASYSVDGAPAGGGDGRVRLILAPRDSGTAPARPPAARRPAPQIEGKK